MNAIKLIKSINDFKNELKDSIYYSNKSKDFIKSEFDKLTDKERIENFIESYQYTSLIKKDFYDNYLTDEQEIDKVIETLNKQDFLDAVNIEKITELINNISEVNELKKEVIEEYLPKYVRNVLRKKVNYNTEISKSRSEFKARRVIARNLQNILFSTNKDEIEKFKKMLMNALEANKKDDFTKFAGFLSAYAIEENTTKFQRAIQEIIHPIYVNSMWYFDKEYPETTYESDFDLNENDISNIENGVTHNGNGRYYEYDYYTLKEYNNKKILVLFSSHKNQSEKIHPIFRRKSISIFDLSKAKGLESFDSSEGFSLINFFPTPTSLNEEIAEGHQSTAYHKAYIENIESVKIHEAIIDKIFLNINSKEIFDHYSDYFTHNNIDKEKSNKRYEFLSNHVNNLPEDINELLKDPVVIKFHELSLTNDINKVDENVNKFLEFLDSKLQ
ncbi:hypothetical protein [Mycoplasmopsis arginini]|uniref:hypothetical protein n=1 Tax=Mycoplasmopsis arginini TaxID=2094 RepID=UPI003D0138D3